MKFGAKNVCVDEPVGREGCAGREEGWRHLDHVAVKGSKPALQDFAESVVINPGDVRRGVHLVAVIGLAIVDVNGRGRSGRAVGVQALESPLERSGEDFRLGTEAHAAHHFSCYFFLLSLMLLFVEKVFPSKFERVSFVDFDL